MKQPKPDYALIPKMKKNLAWFLKAPHTKAIIDIGSKNWKVELLTKDSQRIILVQRKIRFSEQNKEGYLDDEKIKELAETLLYWLKELKQLKILPKNIVMVATEAVRRAKNQTALLEYLKSRGIDFSLKILTHAQEAYYGVEGALHHQKFQDPVNIVEIGGASMQVSFLEDPYFKKKTIDEMFLFDFFGTSHFKKNITFSKENYHEALKQLEKQIQAHPMSQKLLESEVIKKKSLLLVGGSFWRIRSLMIKEGFQVSEEKVFKKHSMQKLFDFVNYKKYEEVSCWDAKLFPDIPGLLISIKILEFLVKATVPERVLIVEEGLRHGVGLHIQEVKNLIN